MSETEKTSVEPSRSLLQVLLWGRRPEWTLFRILIWIALLYFGSQFVVLPVRIQGPSMLPTYKENGVNFINRLAYIRHEPRRGDVVAIRYSGTSIMLLKRVVALPGENVGFKEGKVFINDQMLSEPYVKLPSKWNREPVQVKPNEYFVVGDNRSMSQEDHTFGSAAREKIVGKAVF